jgi:hypothetical protein
VKDSFDYMRHDFFTVSVTWEQEVHPERQVPRTIDRVRRTAMAVYIDKEPSRYWGECIARCIGSVHFARPLMVWASAINEVIEWEMVGAPLIDPDIVEQFQAAAKQVIRAYQELDSGIAE